MCTTHLIDLDADPYVPNGLSVLKHKNGGQFLWDPTKVEFHLSKNQEGEKFIRGDKLRKELESMPVFNANLLDYLFTHQELIPEGWKQDKHGSTLFIFFWGTVYQYDYSGNDLGVRHLNWGGKKWNKGHCWLGYDWNWTQPAIIAVR